MIIFSRTLLLTILTLIAFASNSILCRLALRGSAIDAASFTVIRLASGAIMLWLIASTRSKRFWKPAGCGSWASAFWLFAYAAAFSFAYLGLTAGTGALILFGVVQVTMIAAGVLRGEHPRPIEWLGGIAAFAGLVYLVFPGLSAPPLINALLMATAGVAWGMYSLRGKKLGDPTLSTAGNFIRSVSFVLLLLPAMISQTNISANGFWLAVTSGAITSGIGYVIWYAALRGLTTTRAAVVQLAVPLLSALGGILILSEVLTLRIVISSVIILGGIGLAIAGRRN